jgi:RNA polymerase sigma factor (TIGR02999 family)
LLTQGEGGLDALPFGARVGRAEWPTAVLCGPRMNNRRAVRPKHPDTAPPEDVTGLLAAWNEGSIEARDRLMPLVYDELRRRAGAFIRRERSGHTLQPTALVHEVYLRLVDQDRAMWRNRAQFLAIASEMMRRILVDRARARKMAKRSGGLTRVTLVEDAARREPREVDVLDLDTALDELSSLDPRKARVAELRFFGGLSLEEASHVLGTSVATTMRDWQAARAWLFRRLTRARAAPNGGS